MFFQFMAVCLMLVLLPLTAKALAKFLEALFHRLREFELAISVDKADCFVILWTSKNKFFTEETLASSSHSTKLDRC